MLGQEASRSSRTLVLKIYVYTYHIKYALNAVHVYMHL